MVQSNRSIRQNYALYRGVGDVALMPQSYILQASYSITTQQASHTANLFAGNGVTLVRHCRGALLTRSKIFLGFTNIGALQVADFGSHLVQGGTNDSQGGQEMRMAVTLDNLGCQAYRLQIQLFANIFFYKGIDIGISANSTGELAHSHHFASLLQALHIALNLIGPEQEFHTKGHRFSMNAMSTTDHYGVLEFSSTTAQNGMEILQMTHN